MKKGGPRVLREPLTKSWLTCFAPEIAQLCVTNLANSPRYYLRFAASKYPVYSSERRSLLVRQRQHGNGPESVSNCRPRDLADNAFEMPQ